MIPIPMEYEVRVIQRRRPALPASLVRCSNSRIAWQYWREYILTDSGRKRCKKSVTVILLNNDLQFLGHAIIASAEKDVPITTPDVFRPAVVIDAGFVVVIVSHNSGFKPSCAEMRACRNLESLGFAIGIPVVDFVLAAQERFFSLRESGLMGHPPGTNPN